MPAPVRPAIAGLLAGGALLASLTGCSAAGPATAAGPSGTTHAGAATAATVAVTAAARIAPAQEFGDGTVYDAWITSATPGSPGRVSLELAWHYSGPAAVAYSRAHGLPAPLDDHIDVDRRLPAVVTVSPALQATINPQGAGPRQLTAAAFVRWARQHPAVRAGGQYGGPLYAVTFRGDVLVSASGIFEP